MKRKRKERLNKILQQEFMIERKRFMKKPVIESQEERASPFKDIGTPLNPV